MGDYMVTSTKIVYNGIPFFHPGVLLKEILEARGIDQKVFASRISVSEKHISNIVSGKASITSAIAEKISISLNEDALTWVNMQAEFDQISEKLEVINNLSAHVDILNQYPIKDMIKYKLIPRVKEKWKQLKELMSFFGVGDVTKLKQFSIDLDGVRYRKLETSTTKEATSVLYRWGLKLAEERENVPPYNKDILNAAVENIRNNMCISFEEGLNYIKSELNKAGVIFIFTPKISRASASGCCYKYKNNPVIHLTYRTKQIDTFWFSLFHEIKHILDDDICKEDSNDAEDSADRYAKNTIVPDDIWEEYWFNHAQNYSVENVKSLAQQQKVPNACIVGRLQKDKRIQYFNSNFNRLKETANIFTFDGINFNS